MPKVPAKTTPVASPTPAPTRPSVETHVSNESTLLGGAYSSILHTRNSIATAKEIVNVFASASPKEKEQIKLFTEANTASAVTSKLHPYWFLVRIRDCDTGRSFLAAGCRASGPGVSAKEFRKIIGLR